MGKDRAEVYYRSSCVKCGKCQTVCPVFSVRPEESSSARGKMALSEAVNQGHLDESGTYRDYLETCLLCGACEENCPNEVKTLSTMLGARERMARNARTKAAKRLILRHIVGGPRLLDLAMRAGRAFKGMVFRRIPAQSGIRRRIPLPLITRDRTLPDLSPVFFTERYSGKVNDGEADRLGIFAGCMTNYFYPDTGETMVDLLKERGVSVFVPEGQVCCGMPALTGGARETVRELALQNLTAFEEYDLDAIVTGCASCGSNIKENYGDLLREAGIEEGRVEKFLSSILDINEYLHQHPAPASHVEKGEKSLPAIRVRVTYHHPCHLGRVQGVRQEPVELIKALPEVEFVPMDDADRCCGMGGSFSLEHYDTSKKVNDQKIKSIIDADAHIVATSCPACMMHIRDGLIRNGRGDIEVLHMTDLLERYSRSNSSEADQHEEGEAQERNPGLRAQVSG